METRIKVIRIFLNGELFTDEGTIELLGYFIHAEAISKDFETLTSFPGNKEIKSYYFNTIEED